MLKRKKEFKSTWSQTSYVDTVTKYILDRRPINEVQIMNRLLYGQLNFQEAVIFSKYLDCSITLINENRTCIWQEYFWIGLFLAKDMQKSLFHLSTSQKMHRLAQKPYLSPGKSFISEGDIPLECPFLYYVGSKEHWCSS